MLRRKQKYSKDIQKFVAHYQLDAYQSVFCKWRDIAKTMRQKVYDDDMEEEIDVFDLECKEWGFYLRELFGLGLGTGDYGHLTVEHASMLLRNFRSLRHYSNQGFEAAHKLQKQIFSRATNHDGSGEATSLDQILTHHYAEKLLFLRLCFRNAKECARMGKKFYFRGCGWGNSTSTKRWGATHKRWIEVMDEVFTSFMSEDYLTYKYTGNLCCVVTDDGAPRLDYDDVSWENVVKQKMTERGWLENETPRARKSKKARVPNKSRRQLFKTRKGKRKASTHKRKSSAVPCNRKRKLSSVTSDPAQQSHVPKTRRCLFQLSSRKRKQVSSFSISTETAPLASQTEHTPSASLDLLSCTPTATTQHTPSASCDLLSCTPTATTQHTTPSASFDLLSCTPTATTQHTPSASCDLPSWTPPATIQHTPSASCDLPSWTPPAGTIQHTPLTSSELLSPLTTTPTLCNVFSSTCPREQLLTYKLPPVGCGVTMQQNMLVRVPDDFVFTDVRTLDKRPPARVVNSAITLMINEKKTVDETIQPINLEIDNLGVAIGELGVFSRAGLGQLEWLGEVAEMQYNVFDEKKWLMKSPDNLDKQTREIIFQLLYKFPLNHLVAKEGNCSVTVRAFSKLALERYIDDTVIDTAITRMHRQYGLQESMLCLPAHTITWLDTGDEDFIRQCFHDRLLNVKPSLLSLILIPVNMSDIHWGLMVIDVQGKEAYFDDGLKWNFPRISYVHLIIRELHSKFPECDRFSLNDWNAVKTFKRFGMPRQGTDGQVIGSGSCGVGVILSAQDFMRPDRPASPSWSFNEMTVHRKEIMKLLAST